ncbi:MAG: bifunctional DNA-formamidopyrimidine glycosylase/DNA-(apurinic or apyrimidinic site) lyase [Dehalococcoidia bacterium]|nr:bifunctional DNA-formamidopyrimidine glycosylase/DNA-(apurinic or apyrimidinic site) lyase [Dehalococcoidia bacterium]
MPELPEVETTRRGLHPHLIGRVISDAKIYSGFERLCLNTDVKELTDRLIGQRIEGTDRYGKYLIFWLSSGDSLIVHLRMTGALVLRNISSLGGKYERARLTLESSPNCPFEIVSFDDVRRFGTWNVVNHVRDGLARDIGPDALASDFTADSLISVLRQKTCTIKSALLDQSTLAGLGNIYVDEICFLAGIDPRKRSNTISRKKSEQLFTAIRDTLNKALDQGGSSFSDYVNAHGMPGGALDHCNVYGRAGMECYRCGQTIKKIKIVGRGTHYCPKCQHR